MKQEIAKILQEYQGLAGKETVERIEKLFNTKLQELAEQIEEMKIDNPVVEHNSYGEGFDTGFNEALDGILKLMADMKG